MPAFITNAVQVQRFADALYNVNVGTATMAQVTADITASGGLDNALNAYYSSSFTGVPTATVAANMCTYLGIVVGQNGLVAADVTNAQNYIVGTLNAAPANARGAAVKGILNNLASLTSDKVYGAVATKFNNDIDRAIAYTGAADIAAGTAPAPVVVNSFPLTANSDNLIGTSGADSFNAVLVDNGGTNTLSSFDTISGGDGIDTLNATLTGTAQTISFSTITGIERMNFNVNLPATAGATSLNLVGQNGITAFSLASTNTGNVSFLNLGNIPAFTIGQTGAATDVIDFDAVALAGTSDNLQITLTGSNAGALTITDDGSNPLETITITSSNQANTISTLTTTALGATSLVVRGDQNLTITAAVVDTQATLKTYDASALPSTAALTIGAAATGGTIANATVTGGAGNDSIFVSLIAGNDSLIGGAGNDTFTFGDNLTVADTVDGGVGTDTLSTSVAAVAGLSASSAYSNITGIETLTLSNGLGANTVTTKFIAPGINRVTLSAVTGATNGTLALNSGAQTVALRVAATLAAGQTQTITSDGTATTDALTLLVSPATEAASDFLGSTTSAVTTTGFETVTVNTGSFTTVAATAQNLGALNIGAANDLKVLGTNNLVLATGFVGKSIDASGMTGSSILSMAAATTVDSITGSARGDTIVGDSSSYIDGGAGNDVLTGGAGNDTILGGDGVDTITSSGGVDSILGGAGNDIIGTGTTGITLSSGNVINGGDGTDTLNLAANATSSTGMGVTSIETLGMITTGFSQDMTLFVDNGLNTITRVNVVGAISGTFSNVGSGTNTVGFDTTAATLTAFTRLVDTPTDAVTLSILAGGTVTAATLANENTITVNASTASGNATITTLTAAQVGTLNLGTANSSTGNYVIGTLTTGSLSTVNVNTTGSVNIGATSSTTSRDLIFNAGGASAASVVGGSGFDSITGGGGADSLTGGSGNDTISGLGGNDTITGGIGGDSMTGGSGSDTFVFGVHAGTPSVAASAASNSANWTAADTLTFANGVDIITDFTAGAGGDVISGLQNATAAVTGIGVSSTASVANTNYILSGNWNANTKRFTITADGTGADTDFFVGAGAVAVTTLSTHLILIGVNSANLVAANLGT